MPVTCVTGTLLGILRPHRVITIKKHGVLTTMPTLRGTDYLAAGAAAGSGGLAAGGAAGATSINLFKSTRLLTRVSIF